jgi:hypothetical protein
MVQPFGRRSKKRKALLAMKRSGEKLDLTRGQK